MNPLTFLCTASCNLLAHRPPSISSIEHYPLKRSLFCSRFQVHSFAVACSFLFPQLTQRFRSFVHCFFTSYSLFFSHLTLLFHAMPCNTYRIESIVSRYIYTFTYRICIRNSNTYKQTDAFSVDDDDGWCEQRCVIKL